MSIFQKNILIACIWYAGATPFSSAQEPGRIGKQFAKRYAFVKDLSTLSKIPFPEIAEEEATHVLANSSRVIAPFGAQLPAYPQHYFYQLFGVDCYVCSSSARYYLVAQGGFGSAETRVFGPVDVEESSLQEDVEQLKKINTFAIGMVGFVGHISTGENLYRRIRNAKNAHEIFERILHSTSSTNEAKMYAACGLKKLSPASFAGAVRSLRQTNKTISVLRADVLNKEKISDVLVFIENAGCNEGLIAQ
ncbi:MchS3 family protein [Herbaspirillum rhizosphaerae]|uniref:MchS3 family protein n=1 Tax=Herbaspirillum rhizosphaerae TaxID=346179 RepID=UPI0009F83E36|nr:MchS3 family protein [Herbaspirillum rhizosphaerae]